MRCQRSGHLRGSDRIRYSALRGRVARTGQSWLQGGRLWCSYLVRSGICSNTELLRVTLNSPRGRQPLAASRHTLRVAVVSG